MVDAVLFPNQEPAVPPVPEPSQRMWTYREVASLMAVQTQTIMDWVRKGRIASPVYLGGIARFTQDMVAAIRAGISPAGTFPVADSPRANARKKSIEKAKAKPKPTKRAKPTKKAKAHFAAMDKIVEKTFPDPAKEERKAKRAAKTTTRPKPSSSPRRKPSSSPATDPGAASEAVTPQKSSKVKGVRRG